MAGRAFFEAHLEELRDAARLGPIVDLACGRGRHTLAGASAGLPMIGVDRNAGFLAELRTNARAAAVRVALIRCDLESGFGLPLAAGSCGAIVVFRYLHRPLARPIVDAIAPGGLILYETFSTAQRTLGWGPRNPDFLLAPAELSDLFGGFPDLEILETWDGMTTDEPSAAVGRLLARRR